MTKKASASGFQIGAAELLESFPFYAMIVDSRHRILQANAAVRKIRGFDPANLAGAYCPRIIHGIEIPFPGCPLEKALDTGGSVETEMYDPTHGLWLWSAVYPIGMKTEDGDEIFLHLVQDITDQKAAERSTAFQSQTQTASGQIQRVPVPTQTRRLGFGKSFGIFSSSFGPRVIAKRRFLWQNKIRLFWR